MATLPKRIRTKKELLKEQNATWEKHWLSLRDLEENAHVYKFTNRPFFHCIKLYREVKQ